MTVANGVPFKYQVEGATDAQHEALNTLAQELEVTTGQLQLIVKQFMEEMRKGLDHYGATGNKKRLQDNAFITTILTLFF